MQAAGPLAAIRRVGGGRESSRSCRRRSFGQLGHHGFHDPAYPGGRRASEAIAASTTLFESAASTGRQIAFEKNNDLPPFLFGDPGVDLSQMLERIAARLTAPTRLARISRRDARPRQFAIHRAVFSSEAGRAAADMLAFIASVMARFTSSTSDTLVPARMPRALIRIPSVMCPVVGVL